MVCTPGGYTIKALHNGKAPRVRQNGIDCPEKVQAYGQQAKPAASALARVASKCWRQQTCCR